jgi:MinD superfamily P-loop ATPase
MGLAEKDCAWHSPLLTFVQLKALKNMCIRTQKSEDRRRERWVQKNERYKENREDSRVERRERKDSVPPLGEIPFEKLVTKDLVPSAGPKAEIQQRAHHSRRLRL